MTFDFEKLKVYNLSLENLRQCSAISEKIPRGQKYLSDQLKRAASSITLNIAEGSYEYKKAEKTRFYRMALRSNAETSSVIQIIHNLEIIDKIAFQNLYENLTQVSKMLTKLIKNTSGYNSQG